MSKIEILKKFVEKRLDWNNFLHKKDPKVSDIGRIEEDKCILRYIEKIIEDESTNKDKISDEFKEKFVGILFKSTSTDELSVERLYELVDKIAPEVIEVVKKEIMKKTVVGEVIVPVSVSKLPKTPPKYCESKTFI